MKKELVKILPKEKFATIFLDERLSFVEKIDVFNEWGSGVEIPEEVTTPQELLDFAYDVYLKAIEKYSFDKSIDKIRKNKQEGGSRKDFIINLIQMKDTITYDELYKAVDEKWQYEAVGKSPRVRINNTLKELVSKNKVAKEGNIIKWIGK